MKTLVDVVCSWDLRELEHFEEGGEGGEEGLGVFGEDGVGDEEVGEADDGGFAVVGELDLVGAGEYDGGEELGEDALLDLVDAAGEEVGPGVGEGAGGEEEGKLEEAEEEGLRLGTLETGKEDEENLLDVWREGTTR